MTGEGIHILWFKRDLRFQDHEPLAAAMDAAERSNERVLLLYLLEPSCWEQPQYSDKHTTFIGDSIQQLNVQLAFPRVEVLQMEALEFFKWAMTQWNIKGVYSYMETGIKLTFDRDLAVGKFLKQHGIPWFEWSANGVQRGLRNRQNWVQEWYEDASKTALYTDLNRLFALSAPWPENTPSRWNDTLNRDPMVQKGGEIRAHKVLQSFLSERIKRYAYSISKPRESRRGCSRISPHLAWGNLSIRQVYHAMVEAPEVTSKRNVRAFADRLRWQAHFIQKFESEWEYEFLPINRGYIAIDAQKKFDQAKFDAWKAGMTGVPLVDACMRCVAQTGYLNFRMRAMVVSFYSQYLWQPWKPGADYLASTFTDFEPGIHYAQFQMQSGYTGVNTIRIYNPIKQSQEHDPNGTFIKEWVKELAHLPDAYIHEPWKIPPMERMLLDLEMDPHYPIEPIVPLEKARKHASDVLYGIKKKGVVRNEAQRILAKHVNPSSRRS
jgi:deoxyribodipyrimidine photo-lyase